MGWAAIGTAAVGLVGAGLTAYAKKKNAADKAARDARAQARVDAGDPNQIVPPGQEAVGGEEATAPIAPPAPPSVPQLTSAATVDAGRAAERMRKRAAAGGSVLGKRGTPTSSGSASFTPRTLSGA